MAISLNALNPFSGVVNRIVGIRNYIVHEAKEINRVLAFCASSEPVDLSGLEVDDFDTLQK